MKITALMAVMATLLLTVGTALVWASWYFRYDFLPPVSFPEGKLAVSASGYSLIACRADRWHGVFQCAHTELDDGSSERELKEWLRQYEREHGGDGNR